MLTISYSNRIGKVFSRVGVPNLQLVLTDISYWLCSEKLQAGSRGGLLDYWIKVKNRSHPAWSRVMDSF
jgi:hypothetical protein